MLVFWNKTGGIEMKKKRFSEAQIVRILRAAEQVGNVREICRKENVTEQTFYRWRNKYGGMEVADVKRLKALEEENRRLKQMVADQALDIQVLKEVNAKKW